MANKPVRSVNILLVDDQPRNLDVLVTILEAPDRNLVCARDANEALRALLEQEFALIVLDIQMPEVTGIELAHIIKQRERTQNIPIIFMTAVYQDEQRMLEGYGIGAVDYLTKPVNPKVLGSKVAVFVDLYLKNKALAQEIDQRVKAEEALRDVNEALEERVIQRTAELSTQAARAQLLSTFATELLKTATPLGIFARVFGEINRTGRVDAYYVHLLDLRSSAFVLSESSEPLAGLDDDFRSIPAANGSFDVLQAAIRKTLGSSASDIYPIADGDTVFGTFTLMASDGGTVGGGERQFIRTVCDLVAAILERGRLLCELLEARDRAERAGKAKDEFLAALSHELRTPLNPVLLLASEAATNSDFCAEARSQFDTIRKNIELEARLIDDLLDLTRLTHGKLALEKRPRDIHRVILDAVETVRTEIRQKGIAFHLRLEADHRVVAADDVRLQQVLWNLLRNAIKFTPSGGSITVETRNPADGGTVLVSVADTGIGLAKDEIRRIFDAFIQGGHAATGSTHRFGGLGLGLTISRTLVGEHGGSLRAESEGSGLGATFIVELPLLADAALPAAGDSDTGDAPGPRRVFEQVGRVLLVEDHEPTRKTLETLLRRRNLDVQSAASVAEARRLAAPGEFKILITDIGLPDGTGFDLMEEMKRQHGMRGIALTGYGMEEDLERSRRAGFEAHLTKPIHVHSLDRALTVLLG